MNLSEKIIYCRKKASLSQEALAELIGVSRQAVSKWETGEAVPEIGKLSLLAKTFGVTTDWLLSNDEAEPAAPAMQEGKTNWIDSLPGVIGKLIRRYGWLYGVYTALVGLAFIALGLAFNYLSSRMFDISLFPDASFPKNPIVYIAITLGALLAVAGTVLAIVLKRHSERETK